jgi:hypothetical protein
MPKRKFAAFVAECSALQWPMSLNTVMTLMSRGNAFGL